MGASGDKKTIDPNGKAAMERVGLFSEVGYISIGMKTGAIWRIFDQNSPKNCYLSNFL